jgi:hypothetical protein
MIVHTYRGSGSLALTTIRGAEKPTEYSKKTEMFDVTSRRRNARSPYGRQALICIKQCLSDLRCYIHLFAERNSKFENTKARHRIFG